MQKNMIRYRISEENVSFVFKKRGEGDVVTSSSSEGSSTSSGDDHV